MTANLTFSFDEAKCSLAFYSYEEVKKINIVLNQVLKILFCKTEVTKKEEPFCKKLPQFIIISRFEFIPNGITTQHCSILSSKL